MNTGTREDFHTWSIIRQAVPGDYGGYRGGSLAAEWCNVFGHGRDRSTRLQDKDEILPDRGPSLWESRIWGNNKSWRPSDDGLLWLWKTLWLGESYLCTTPPNSRPRKYPDLWYSTRGEILAGVFYPGFSLPALEALCKQIKRKMALPLSSATSVAATAGATAPRAPNIYLLPTSAQSVIEDMFSDTCSRFESALSKLRQSELYQAIKSARAGSVRTRLAADHLDLPIEACTAVIESHQDVLLARDRYSSQTEDYWSRFRVDSRVETLDLRLQYTLSVEEWRGRCSERLADTLTSVQGPLNTDIARMATLATVAMRLFLPPTQTTHTSEVEPFFSGIMYLHSACTNDPISLHPAVSSLHTPNGINQPVRFPCGHIFGRACDNVLMNQGACPTCDLELFPGSDIWGNCVAEAYLTRLEIVTGFAMLRNRIRIVFESAQKVRENLKAFYRHKSPNSVVDSAHLLKRFTAIVDGAQLYASEQVSSPKPLSLDTAVATDCGACDDTFNDKLTAIYEDNYGRAAGEIF
ncbi:uncharacterized protein BDZ99DRAFT_548102 [Mytilinidion resinicola]|uniref:Uncharacterized protein n=1 Tax=Mytilinidion resinicola TaxID=574789 RepID=A0A6A6Y271_9PEZI|nr:uncharacterized protein BDZ99DRAFT_548102 [Mytilinidion resinicola]KAF2802882.1 hypothetical protein BDZ99DRAFT_548102 [Mytilinidion resinicola]